MVIHLNEVIIRVLIYLLDEALKTTAERVEFMMVTLKIKEQTEFGKYIDHLYHATSVLHPELGNKSSIIKKDKKNGSNTSCEELMPQPSLMTLALTYKD